MTRHKTRLTCAAVFSLTCFVAGLTLAPPRSEAFDLKDLLKVAGIGLLVKQFGGEINKVINRLMSQQGVATEAATKVVPVLEVGSDTAIGAVQVVGPASQVARVQAVAEIEITVGNRFRARGLLPVTARRVDTKTIRGVDGVGVSANIKHPL